MAETETVVINTATNVAGVVRAASKVLALIAAHPASGATVSSNVVKKYRRFRDAETDFGTGSAIALGVQAALGSGVQFVFAVTAAARSGSPFSETFGASTVITEGDINAARLPLTAITAVSRDGVNILANVVYTELAGAALSAASVPASGMYINTTTGEFKIGTATTGSGPGLVVSYSSNDWNTALERLDLENYEAHSPAGLPFNAQNAGIYDLLLDHATNVKKVVIGAFASGVAPADVEDLVVSVRNGRLKLYAAYYTGDAVSAFAANEMLHEVNSTTKEQRAPTGLTFTDSYDRGEYGDEEDPATGTFHNMGANAAFRDRGGTYRISNDRACTGLTDFERFFSTRRSLNFVENELEADLLGARRGNGLAFPFTEAGIAKVKRICESTLNRLAALVIIDSDFSVVVPELVDVVDNDRLNRVLRGIEVQVRLAGQIHMFVLNLNVFL